ncbi:MAG: Fic family protein [Gammaproteobacteria bacterium]|nr:Fic family protein [Gammaproteobacteria bacterium]MDP2347849.1 Fic family protein [Gammaproteobacteria bacterium]
MSAQVPAYVQYERVPDGTVMVGWAALVHALGVDAPLRRFACVSEKHVSGNRRVEGNWEIFDKRYMPGDSLTDQLNFALRHEQIDLLVMKRTFDLFPEKELTDFIKATPTGGVARRVWFFFETLTGRTLNLDDADPVTAVDALEPDNYFTVKGKISQRHRVRDNLLGTGKFCPVIRRTQKLEDLINLNLAQKAQNAIGKIGAHVVARAASFMLRADSKASFEIEGERPPQNKLERWGRAVLEAGQRPLNQTEIYRLQRTMIGDDRFIEIGYRTKGVFLGIRDSNNEPVPEFIGARHEDLSDLMLYFNECNNRLRHSEVDPVLQAAAIAFGFVYIHPLEDGNGRLHRCLIHHVLAERKFSPPGMVFPVSSVMADEIDQYRETLQSHSRILMNHIDWRPLPSGNVEVINDTSDLYRFFDCTDNAEFLYECVRRTIEKDLPREIDYLIRHDSALKQVMDYVEMPDKIAQDLIMHIRSNGGKLSLKRRKAEFVKLSDEEVIGMENIINSEFEGFDS